jgi:hypothetical protein
MLVGSAAPSATTEAPRTVPPSAEGAGRRPRPGALLTLAVAVAVGLLAFNGGGFAVDVRNPAGIALWWALALAVALGVWPRSRIPRPALACAALLGAFVVLSGLSATWAESAEGAIGEAGRAATYLGAFLLVLAATRRGVASRWSDGLAAGIAVVGVVALASRLFPGLGLEDASSRLFDQGGYLSFPLDYWNGVGAFVALGFPLLLRAGLEARGPWVRAAAIGVLPALACALYLTSSRGGMLAAAIGVALFIALTGRRLRAAAAAGIAVAGSIVATLALNAQHELVNGPFGTPEVAAQGRRAALLVVVLCLATAGAWHLLAPRRLPLPRIGRRPRIALAGLGAVLLIAAVAAAHPGARFDSFTAPPPNPFAQTAAQQGQDIGTGSHLASSASNGRWQFWGAAVDEFSDRPLLGHGAGSYEAWWAQHGSIPYFTRYAHSLYLETMGELGLAGLLLLAALLLTVAVTAARRLRTPGADRTAIAGVAGAAGAFAVAAGIDWIWQIPVIAIVGLTTFALLVGPATAPGAPARATGRRRLRVRALVAVPAALAIVLLALPWLSDRQIAESRKAALSGSVAHALDAARHAQSLQPWAASPHLQHALVLEGAGDLDGARRELGEAVRRDPSDWRLALVQARVANAAGDTVGARAALDRARALNPRSSLFAKDPAR